MSISRLTRFFSDLALSHEAILWNCAPATRDPWAECEARFSGLRDDIRADPKYGRTAIHSAMHSVLDRTGQ